MSHRRNVAVIGLGYVGLPVAVELGKIGDCWGFDVNTKRVHALKQGVDDTLEVDSHELKSTRTKFTDQLNDLKHCDFFIVAVPTPVDEAKRPDLTALVKASETVGKVLKKGDIVVYESTVYPGCTEEDCIPVLERVSGLKGGRDFTVGYSPERINPGDKEHSLSKITKVVSGQDAPTLDAVASVYGSIVTAGVHRASSIKVAEAAKVIENTQRDLNIALMNELAIIFDLMGIDTLEVLQAAGTKWNFLKFSPGLVGGHCIGVDPYYLTHQAEKLGYHPEVILAGRRINDSVAKFVVQRTVKELVKGGHPVQKADVAILGATFKENCPDIRNSKIHDIILELKDYGITPKLCDPWADAEMVKDYFGIELTPIEKIGRSHALILAVAHQQYKSLSVQAYRELCHDHGVVIDIKGIANREQIQALGLTHWRL